MSQKTFKALIVEEQGDSFTRSIQMKSLKDLPDNDMLVQVHYSSLNYKDALSATGNKGVTRKYPHTPGIDAVGIVVDTKSDTFSVGDKVIVTSFDLGMNTDGGFGQYIKVPEDWALLLPDNLSMKEAMIIGTAGLTAGMSVLKLNEIVKPGKGEIIVSGATGGVGAMSIALLKKLGYKIAAITGKDSEHDFLRQLGADRIISRQEFENMDDKPILKSEFAGAIDTVGGVILENIIKSVKPMGAVTCCGNVASPKLNLTVFPFILRGITLIGIDSQNYPMWLREKVWLKLANEWKPDNLEDASKEITLDELNEKIDLILEGRLKGRTVVNLQA
ncbi:putative YhdH/YhfP family quinone oxidoreductase [Flavobacteriaceae bacterium MAR_2009_75]|nr:putative YhdH/YhfP family quinone oxidoreductase [Flavobacteriaceae bacterium MAR_2009_75]